MFSAPTLGVSETPMHVVKMLMMETGTYNNMASRPYSAGLMDGNTLGHLQMATQGGRNYQRSALAGVSNQLLRPSPEPEMDMNTGRPLIHEINNGWQEKRMWFMIHLERPTGNHGSKAVEIVTGYTDHLGMSTGIAGNDQYLAPDMQLFINTVWRFRSMQMSNPQTGQMEERLVPNNASHYLGGQYNPMNPMASTQYMRPKDVLLHMGLYSEIGMSGEAMVNTSNTPAGQDRKSKRGHGNSAQWLSEIMGAYNKDKEQRENQGGGGFDSDFSESEIYYSAAGGVPEDTVAYDPFVQMVNKVGFLENSCFSWGDLSRLFPEVQSREITKAFTLDARGMQQVHNADSGMTPGWHGTNQETVFASTLSSAIPAIMMDNMLTQFNLHGTNRTESGQFELTPSHANSFLGQRFSLRDNIGRVIERINVEVLPGLTSFNDMDVMFEFQFDILSESRVRVAFNGGEFIDFAIPSFADGLFAPVVSRNHNTISTLSQNLNAVFNNIGVDYSTPRTQPMTQGATHGQSQGFGSNFTL